MSSEHILIPSRAMERRMHLWRFGHFGMPVIVFPSAAGMAHEWQAHGMVEALDELIGGGKIKLYCTESNVAEAWTRKESDPAWRIQRHIAYERYIVDELVPWIRDDCRSSAIPLAATGTSLGAFYSVNFALKFPSIFRWALGMSGRYDATWINGGFSNGDVYFNNPMSYLPHLAGEALARVQRETRIVLVCGQGRWEDGNIEETSALAALLRAKAVPHELDLWGHDVAHEWTWWRRQARYHFGRAFGA